MGVKGGWFRRRPSDDEMREELEAHVAMRAEHDRVDEAAARRRLGNLLHTRESMRRVWIAEWWDALRQDAHFTWRSWQRRPAFALAAILVLGLGLGASTALFAALDRVLFRPLPYADPDRLVSAGVLTARTGEPFVGGPEMMRDRSYVQVWATTPAPFESVTGVTTLRCTIAEDQPEGVPCGAVEHNFLGVLGARVILGRDFTPEDDVRGAPRGALISHRLWVRRYGADPGVVGRRLSLDTSRGPMPQIPVLGVLPAEFEMPVDAADILLPQQMRPLDPKFPLTFPVMTFARLKPDVTPERAEAMLASQWADTSAFASPGFRAVWRVRSLYDRRVGDAARVAWLLIGAVTVFLLIACVNVTNLILARVAERQREFAVRAALGAGQLRLAGLALVETLLLATAAGGVGLLLAYTLLKTFVAMAPAVGVVAKSVAEASIDVRVFVAAVLLVVMTGMAIGLWPAISVFRAGGMQGLRSTGTSSPGAKPRVRFALVTTQIALTLALLGGSALLLRTLWNVVNVPLGFDGERVITLTAEFSTRYSTFDRWTAFLEELLARARATPGAVSAALSDGPAPPQPPLQRTPIDIEGQPPDPSAPRPAIRFRWVTSQYFDTFQIRLVRGRTAPEINEAGEPMVVVLNESAERVLFRGERALGRRIQSPVARFVLERSTPKALPRPWFTVVGVSADIRNGQALTDGPDPEIYLVARPGQGLFLTGHLSLRTTARPADANAFLRQIAADLDPKQLVTIRTQEELLTELTAQPRFIAWLLTAFAALALLLAAAGLYSVASYLVMQRRHDIGVRMAIGASPRDVARQVVGEAGRWIIGGALVGSALGWMGTRALQSQLYQVEALDPWSWTGALVVLAVVLVVAVLRPAYLAAHVDPVAALRSE